MRKQFHCIAALKVFVLLIILSFHSEAQQSITNLDLLARRSPIEKVYLHTDRESYHPGETIWFKAYLYSEYFPDTISTTLFVELIDENAERVSSQVLPVVFTVSQGQFELSDTIAGGAYFVRAYSPTMLNQGEDFVFVKNILIHNTGAAKKKRSIPTGKSIQFFPESGSLVDGIQTRVAFKATNGSGLPIQASGTIKNSKGETVARFASYHDGMGMFHLLPEAAEQYVAIFDKEIQPVQYNLPGVETSGVVLSVNASSGKISYDLYKKSLSPEREPAYIVGHMQHIMLFKTPVNSKSEKISRIINNKNIPPGILHITVFNKDNMPLAERLFFIRNSDYVLPVAMKLDTINNGAKAKNSLTLTLPEGTIGSFSIAVTDADYPGSELRSENILSSLLLTSDLKGFVHRPSWYFAPTTDLDSANQALDLLMMVNGWSRFQWNTLAASIRRPLRYKDPGYLSITGQVNLRNRKKAVENRTLALWHFTEDSLQAPQMGYIETDYAGNFRADSLIFFGNARFLVSDISKKSKKWIDVVMSADSVQTYLPLRPLDRQKIRTFASIEEKEPDEDFVDLFENSRGVTMQGVRIRSYRKSATQLLDEKYSSPLFRAVSARIYDLVNMPKAEKLQMNIFDYIQSRVSGVQVSRGNGPFDYKLYYRQRMSLGTGQMIPMTVYLDEAEVPIATIATIPARQVAMIKILSHFIGRPGNAAGGVLAIYTRKDEDAIPNLDDNYYVFNYPGYSVVKEFYSPDYDSPEMPEAEKNASDDRKTLLWRPQVLTSDIDTVIPVQFYNSDRVKNFKLVIEGITSDGKFVSFEKVIPGNQAN